MYVRAQHDRGALLLLNPASPAQAMAEAGGGSIVLTSAAVAETGVPGFEAMSAAKAGVDGGWGPGGTPGGSAGDTPISLLC